jgi:hypothetical protein
MNANQLMDELFSDHKLRLAAEEIAKELANRGLHPGHDFPQFVREGSERQFTKRCTDFHAQVCLVLQKDGNLQKLMTADNGEVWLNMLRFFVKDESDINSIGLNLSVALIQHHSPGLDTHVEHLSDDKLLNELDIEANDYMLVSLNDKRLSLRHQGIIFEDRLAIYPHQFLRRYYTSNFVDTLEILAKMSKKSDVSIRIDPLRSTDAHNYVIDGILEADLWYGPKFSAALMQERYKTERTVHRSFGVVDHRYFAEFTVFRTTMMASRQRQIFVEEYCPLETPSGQFSPGWGSKYFIQKFGHLVFDQDKDAFVHMDGAVRVFKIDDYSEYFDEIQSGRDNHDHIGQRHKMFLVEDSNGIELDGVEALLSAWFRYNPHIQEYFSGTEAENQIPLEIIKAARAGKLKAMKEGG